MKQCTQCGEQKPEQEFWFNERKGRRLAHCDSCRKAMGRKWREANKNRIAEQNRVWQSANPERVKAAQQRWKDRNPGVAAQRMREWRINNLERHREGIRQNSQRVKDACYNAYGGYVCACCGETEPAFLSLDHVNNDGAQHRREIGGGGRKTYSWLIANDFPPGFQVLCMNCNWGKARNGGVCPHQKTEGSTTRA